MGISRILPAVVAGWLSVSAALFTLQSAHAGELRGEVLSTTSRWAAGGKSIISESRVALDDGRERILVQRGGTVNGIGMWQSHAPALLQAGDRFVAEAQALRAQRYRVERLQSLQRSPDAASSDELEFVRTQNESGEQIFWKSGCAIVHSATEGSTQIPQEREFELVSSSLQHWEESTANCSNFALENGGKLDSEVGFDGVNLIKWREEEWCRPAFGDEDKECYDSTAAGITTLFFIDSNDSSRNGEILDADIEINGVHFAIAADGQSGGGAGCQSDFASTLTHELGHLLGLDHSCWPGGPRFEDGQGNPAPSCTGNIDPRLIEASMYAFQGCGETKKASLEDDDIAGLCAIYPQGEDLVQCKPADLPDGGCCSVAGARSRAVSSWSAVAILLLGFLAWRSLREQA